MIETKVENQNLALLRAVVVLFFLLPFLGWIIGIGFWHSFGDLPPRLNYSQNIELFASYDRVVEHRSGKMDLPRIQTISGILLFGVFLQLLVGVALAIRAFIMRAVLRVPGYKLPSLAHIIGIFFATWFLAWILFISPFDTIGNGKLGEAVVVTDFRFVAYIVIFTAFNSLLAFNISLILQLVHWAINYLEFE